MPRTFEVAQVGTVETWEREREMDKVENERQRVLRSSPSPGNQHRFHSDIPTTGPHELATHQDQESTRERTQDRYDDPEIDRTLADQELSSLSLYSMLIYRNGMIFKGVSLILLYQVVIS
ncbi:hypothetical protein EYC80_005967 [Monilinia laxa]|uniref:Uncharacterized protein n=1 Tax=Monilinia laxa TaxID=61186 RepID=A0A5N6KH83_MONLA|nr:hypothetical protein EYC80_005967 [Monilinia laxa]